LVNWVENGIAPQAVIATARPGVNPDVPASWATNGKPRTRPLCAYPTQVRYNGQGDINAAENFSCK
jgi:feruloyl esterase